MTTPSTGERIAWRSTWSFEGRRRSSSSRNFAGRLLELFGGGLLVAVARVGHARLQFAGTLARQGQLAARFIQAAARIGVRALQRQQPRARHITLLYELLVEREFFGREAAGFANRFDLAFQRR